tara:strand:- start:2 stop:1021 length:1020 start_codon:yes stop_codon:yes gene_type:complete
MNLFHFISIALYVKGFHKSPLKIIKTVPHSSYNQDGDYSGDYQLSGLWKFEVQSIDIYKPTKKPEQISWSGDSWLSPKREYINFESFYVNLESSGSFSTPVKIGKSKFRGKWSCKGNEITLTRFKYGYTEIESYIGTYSPENNGTIYGVFTFGAIDPFYTGTFKMTHLMSSFNPIQKNIDINENKTIFKAKTFVGNWQLLFKGETSFSTYNIRLYRNLTWESTNYIGNKSKLAGYWNLYNESVDTTTGISGKGSMFWLWIRRFGYVSSNTSGTHLEQDRMYLGIIHPAPSTNKTAELLPKNIDGDVSIGWSTEPEFIGRFTMKPIFNDETWDFDTRISG